MLEKFKEHATSFQELLECPVCFVTMDSTLKLCINGHGVCNLCAGKIEKCPTCKEELASVLRKNTLLGQIIERLPKLCLYSDKGCSAVFFNQEHHTYCEYRPTECLTKNCHWEGCVKDLIHHVKHCDDDCKKGVFKLGLEYTRWYILDVNATVSYFKPIICQNQVFWKYFHRDGVTKCINHNLYSVPTSKQSCDYYLVIKFEKGKLKFEHSCKAKPYISKENEGIIQSGLVISDCEMRNFLISGTDTKYRFSQKLLKEELSGM